MSEDNDELDEIKVILVGEAGTGKTSLINVAIGEKFDPSSQSTLLSTFVPKKYERNGKNYTLNIWDTAGQEKFRAMTKIFTKNSKIVIFVYAINNRESFEIMKTYWVNSIKESLGDEPIIGIVGNKSDLFLEEKVKEEEGKEFANQLNVNFKLVTAKEDPVGFVDFMGDLLDEFLEKKGIKVKGNNFNINNKPTVKKKKFC